MRGAKPQPTKLKILRGNPGKRALNKSEPQPDPGIPDKPILLNPDAMAEWDNITPKLAKMGVLTVVDGAALAAYCQAYGRWKQVEQMLNKTGVVYRKKLIIKDKAGNEKTEDGEIIVNPLLWIANRAMEQMRQFLVEFGMTPSSRSRVHVNVGESEDPYEVFRKSKDDFGDMGYGKAKKKRK